MVRKIGHQPCTGDTRSRENERNAKERIIRFPNVQSWWDLKWTFLSPQMWDLGTTRSRATDHIFQKHLASDPRADWNIPRQIFLDTPEKKHPVFSFIPKFHCLDCLAVLFFWYVIDFSFSRWLVQDRPTFRQSALGGWIFHERIWSPALAEGDPNSSYGQTSVTDNIGLHVENWGPFSKQESKF